MPITTGVSQTVSTVSSSTTSSTTVNPLPPVALINLILADVNAILPNFNGLVSSYRLLVGAAEEIRRTPELCPDVFERAVRRYDNAGLLLDVLLELLCCKIVFSSELLQVTCGPVDLIRYLLTCIDGDDTPCRSAQTVVGLEALKRLQDKFCDSQYCLPDHDVICQQPAGIAAAASPQPQPPAQPPPLLCESDIAEIIEVKLLSILNKYHLIGKIRPDAANTGSEAIVETADPAAQVPYTSRLHPKYTPGSSAKMHRKRN
ncbi:MAG: hypothetical protein E6X17_00970 [Sporomusaceae bacterium]|nr:hypothetical protein [Sporomusaceae bacterium]